MRPRHLFPLGLNAEGRFQPLSVHFFHTPYDDDYIFLYY